jgi:hypothetical protein
MMAYIIILDNKNLKSFNLNMALSRTKEDNTIFFFDNIPLFFLLNMPK